MDPEQNTPDKPEGEHKSFWSKMTKNQKIWAGVIIFGLILVIFAYYAYMNKEKFTQFTVDMASARHPDPTWMKYAGRIRAPSGLDRYDNFYENKMLWQQGVADRLEGLPAFDPRSGTAPYPRITVSSQYGLERGDRQDTFRNSELTWANARDELNKERPVAPATRNEIEARAAAAENAALNGALDDSSSLPAEQDSLSEKLLGRY